MVTLASPTPTLPAKDGPQSQETPEAASLAALREDYFSFLARQFPTLCLHDEFIFFPRLEAAWEHWFKAAQLEAAVLTAAADRVVQFLDRLEKLIPQTQHPEAAADAVLLRQSLKSVHRQLGPGGPWEWDPFLYLKVAALTWAPVLARLPHLDWHNQEKLAELLAQVSQIFTWGQRQVRALTRPGRLLSKAAFADASRFWEEVVPAFLAAHFPASQAFDPGLKEISRNLQRFQERMAVLPESAPFARGEAGLAEILTQSWGWTGDLKQAAALLSEEIKESRAGLARAAGHIKPGLSWEAALKTIKAPAAPIDLLSLYRGEVGRLWEFWQQAGVLPPPKGRVLVAPTPIYLQTLRSSASYAAPWGPPQISPGFFYISPDPENLDHHFRHHRFLSAHETVPGHHFLDTTRLALTSPVRRQYESPLFYEGWACYAETLLLSQGYLSDSHDYLVGWQRRLWRALRGQVDLELQRGRWDLEEGLRRLGEAGYPETAVRVRLLHLALNPGYQLCYILGLKELLSLRGRFAPYLGLARFHEIVLSGGQLPFKLVEERLGGGPGS